MCVAIILPNGSPAPVVSDLELMKKTNPHGAGVAWVQNGQVHWHKGLDDMAQLSEILGSLPRPTLLHFRLSSIGGVNPHLCHPFPVERNPRTHLRGHAQSVMIHNGHWSGHAVAELFLPNYAPGKYHSDTRVIAHIASTNRPDVLKHIGTTQKFAILRTNKTVLQYGAWTETKDGTRYSNMYWKPKPPTPKVSSTMIDQYIADYRAKEHKRATFANTPYQRMSEAEYDLLMREADNA